MAALRLAKPGCFQLSRGDIGGTDQSSKHNDELIGLHWLFETSVGGATEKNLRLRRPGCIDAFMTPKPHPKKTNSPVRPAEIQDSAAPGGANTEPTSEDVVSKRAYELWLERGCPEGSPEEDWYRAERELGIAAVSDKQTIHAAVRQDGAELRGGSVN